MDGMVLGWEFLSTFGANNCKRTQLTFFLASHVGVPWPYVLLESKSIAVTPNGTNMNAPKTNIWLPPIAFVEEGWSWKLSHTSLLTCDGPLLGVHGEWWAQKYLPCPSLRSLHAPVLLVRVKRTAEKRTNPWHSNLARRPLVRLLANKCLHLLLHNPHFPPLTTSNGKFSLQWQNITYVVHALFQ